MHKRWGERLYIENANVLSFAFSFLSFRSAVLLTLRAFAAYRLRALELAKTITGIIKARSMCPLYILYTEEIQPSVLTKLY
jgi:hypothetical protein